MNYYLVSYDLNRPGQDYADLIAEIERSPNWAKPMLSCFIVGTNENPSQLMERLRPWIDPNDWIIVIRVCKDWDGWLTNDIHDWIRTNVPYC